MSTKKPETLLVGKIMKYLDTVQNCCYEKRHGSMYSVAGEPDISACINGRRVEIEVKVPSAAAIKRADPMVFIPLYPSYTAEMMREHEAMGGKFGHIPGRSATDLQIQRLLSWEASGAVAFIAYSVEAVKYVVEKLQRGEIK